jgi:hypothetical protein
MWLGFRTSQAHSYGVSRATQEIDSNGISGSRLCGFSGRDSEMEGQASLMLGVNATTVICI